MMPNPEGGNPGSRICSTSSSRIPEPTTGGAKRFCFHRLLPPFGRNARSHWKGGWLQSFAVARLAATLAAMSSFDWAMAA